MTIVLAVLAVALAACCVWLTVRIVNRKERWAKWTLAGVVGVPVLYVLSFGPACWMMPQREFGPGKASQAPWLYWPIGFVADNGPAPVQYIIARYATMYCDSGVVLLPADLQGRSTVLWR